MNYIKHLTHWFELLKSNEEAKPTHIALYMALFQLWNQSRFLPSFIINKTELMSLCKMGGKTTYSNCMSDMNRWGWIQYIPNYSNYGASTVSLTNWSEDHTNNKNRNRTVNSTPSRTASESATGIGNDTATRSANEIGTRSAMSYEEGYNNKTYKQQTGNNKDLNNLKKNYHEPM